ncbi:hypothetical protein AGMMS49593_10300 [Endomicrobiia bacterium]|nr:hypothetical protein AGMMS49593_10300 [Endomicrobiia bacterium]
MYIKIVVYKKPIIVLIHLSLLTTAKNVYALRLDTIILGLNLVLQFS